MSALRYWLTAGRVAAGESFAVVQSVTGIGGFAALSVVFGFASVWWRKGHAVLRAELTDWAYGLLGPILAWICLGSGA